VGEVHAGLERDAYLPSDAIVTRGERGVGNNAVSFRRVVFQFFVNSLSNA
jgi:hypothetical protein